MRHYDYIIVGAGAAGLMLANAMGKDSFFKEKKILLLDKDVKKVNDRTWCFWEKGEGEYDKILHTSWKQIYFGGHTFSKNFETDPYTYKMLRGIDFYTFQFQSISKYKNISFSQESVMKSEEKSDKVIITTNANKYTAEQVFNSVVDLSPVLSQTKYPLLQQHFLGWFVKTQKAVFEINQATFMDFSISQKGNTRFMYILPFSKTEALVEYTLFSEKLLPEHEYEVEIKNYLQDRFGLDTYEISHIEQGSIPMTCYDFSKHNSERVLNIGIAGGWAKPSTGYVFQNTSKKTRLLLNHLKEGKSFSGFSKKSRFWYYDVLLLDILHRNNEMGQSIFEALFKKRSPQLIFKFLDEETHFWEDLKIISACPKKPFIKALLNCIFVR